MIETDDYDSSSHNDINESESSNVNLTPSETTIDANCTNNSSAIVCVTSELESKIIEKDNEISKLTKLVTKYERLLEKANKYNEDLRNELSVLSSEVHTFRTPNMENKTIHTQVAEADIEEAYGNKPMPEWGTVYGQGSVELSIADSLKAVAEAELQLQQNNIIGCQHSEYEQQKSEADPEYVYDKASGLYYHSATGYYWDPNFGLFYDHTAGTYYQYNEVTGEYEVHSQIAITGQSHTPLENGGNIEKIKSKENKGKIKNVESHEKRLKRKLKWKQKSSRSLEAKHSIKTRENRVEKDVIIDKTLGDNFEVTKLNQEEKLSAENTTEKECASDEISDVDEVSECDSESSGSLATGESELVSEPESGELTSESSSSDVEMMGMEALPVLYDSQTELAENYPPCIRVIVQSSDHLRCGSLYIITCTGGSIGRDRNRGHAIEIDDINVSKLHAEIAYDYEKQCYILRDKGSQNGTSLNGKRLSENKSESDCRDLHHDDILQIGSTIFLLHIHKGHETCDSCEPGQVQAKMKAANSIKNDYVIMSQDEKNRQRRKELKNIKKKYGLQNSYYEVSGAINSNPDYCDKAYLRRQFIGSESDVFKQHVAPASVQRPISALNKGHKLLAKMGWKEGEGLGKNSSGIAEPINVELRINQTAGLGSSTDVSLSLDNVQHARKSNRWAQAKKRYEKLDDSNRETQASASSQISSLTSSEWSNSNPLSASLAGSDSPFSVSSRNEFALFSSLTHDSSTVTDESKLNVLRPSGNAEQRKQNLQTKVGQHGPKIWIRGHTEQIGQLVPSSNPSAGDKGHT